MGPYILGGKKGTVVCKFVFLEFQKMPCAIMGFFLFFCLIFWGLKQCLRWLYGKVGPTHTKACEMVKVLVVTTLRLWVRVMFPIQKRRA